MGHKIYSKAKPKEYTVLIVIVGVLVPNAVELMQAANAMVRYISLKKLVKPDQRKLSFFLIAHLFIVPSFSETLATRLKNSCETPIITMKMAIEPEF